MLDSYPLMYWLQEALDLQIIWVSVIHMLLWNLAISFPEPKLCTTLWILFGINISNCRIEWTFIVNFLNYVISSDIEDISDVLEITVLDENRKTKADFLGKVHLSSLVNTIWLLIFQVLIPLLQVRDSEKKWYSLKEKKLSKEARGKHPEIQIETKIIWNKYLIFLLKYVLILLF